MVTLLVDAEGGISGQAGLQYPQQPRPETLILCLSFAGWATGNPSGLDGCRSRQSMGVSSSASKAGGL